MLVRWPGPDRSVTPDHIANYERRQLDDVRNEDQRRRVARYLSEQTYPDLLPAFGGMRVDAAGDLWVEAYHLDWEATRRWMVFDRAHRMLGTVEVPGGVLVLQVGDDFVLGWTWDEFDVESIVSYALIKPQGLVPRRAWRGSYSIRSTTARCPGADAKPSSRVTSGAPNTSANATYAAS